MENFDLDHVDRAILRVLQDEGDISQSALAEKVGASPASCWRRIKALENAGVLGRTVRLVDADKIGKGLNVFCQVKMKTHDPATRRDFEQFIASYREVLECYSMSGEWDYLIRAVVADVGNPDTRSRPQLFVALLAEMREIHDGVADECIPIESISFL
jgi:DNA-binding Lrp family transcriptional regulator